jgi:hypothetical protein
MFFGRNSVPKGKRKKRVKCEMRKERGKIQGKYGLNCTGRSN